MPTGPAELVAQAQPHVARKRSASARLLAALAAAALAVSLGLLFGLNARAGRRADAGLAGKAASGGCKSSTRTRVFWAYRDLKGKKVVIYYPEPVCGSARGTLRIGGRHVAMPGGRCGLDGRFSDTGIPHNGFFAFMFGSPQPFLAANTPPPQYSGEKKPKIVPLPLAFEISPNYDRTKGGPSPGIFMSLIWNGREYAGGPDMVNLRFLSRRKVAFRAYLHGRLLAGTVTCPEPIPSPLPVPR